MSNIPNDYPYESLSFQKIMTMGLGDALGRLIRVHNRITAGIATSVEKEERELILQALNSVKLSIGFDCDMDGVPDTVEIFTHTAMNSCCRLLPLEEDETSQSTHEKAQKKEVVVSTSRLTPVEVPESKDKEKGGFLSGLFNPDKSKE